MAQFGRHLFKHLSKGSLVMLEGEIVYRNYEDKDGNKRSITEIKAAKVIFLKIKKDEIEATSAEEEESK